MSAGPVALRPWREGDARSAADWGLDEEIVRWTGVPPGSSISKRLDWIAYTRDAARRGLGSYFVIVVDGALAGACDLRLVDRDDPRIAEIGYLVTAPFRRQGVASRALRLMLSWAFDEPLRIERAQALVDPGNDASAALLESLGFAREGLLRAYRADAGGREDRVIWSLLPIDWRAA
ncbi:MAG: GNAT family N-acetyltransferase [Actinomycetota bacterium]|nr:GNAT family N-acetyltransferase [Actinomycetota bacterium]